MFIVLNYNLYNIIKLKKDITEKVLLVVLHRLATIDVSNSHDSTEAHCKSEKNQSSN